MIVRRVTLEMWEMAKEVRLAALKEAPYAFGTRYEEAIQRTEDEWREIATARAFPADDSLFLAFVGEEAVGIAGGFRDRENPDRMDLTSVWVAPHWRGTGVASALIEAVCDAATLIGATHIAAWVVEGNDRALHLYNRLGFVTQPDRQPYPPNPALEEILTIRQLDR